MSSLERDMGAMLQSGKFSDYTLQINGYEMKVHKCVLAARSPIFCHMFESGTSLPYVPAHFATIQALVTYLYTGKMVLPSVVDVGLAMEVLIAANAYGVPALAKMANEYLLRHMTIAEKNIAIRVLVDLDAGTIEYMNVHRGQYLGVAFREVRGPVKPAVAFGQSIESRIQIQEDSAQACADAFQVADSMREVMSKCDRKEQTGDEKKVWACGHTNQDHHQLETQTKNMAGWNQFGGVAAVLDGLFGHHPDIRVFTLSVRGTTEEMD